MTDTYLLRIFDDVPATHVVREMYMTAGEIWQANGLMFVPSELADRLGDEDSTVVIGEQHYPAWALKGTTRGRFVANKVARTSEHPRLPTWDEVQQAMANLAAEVDKPA